MQIHHVDVSSLIYFIYISDIIDHVFPAELSGAGLQGEPLDGVWQVGHGGQLSLMFDGLQSPNLEEEEEPQ